MNPGAAEDLMSLLGFIWLLFKFNFTPKLVAESEGFITSCHLVVTLKEV